MWALTLRQTTGGTAVDRPSRLRQIDLTEPALPEPSFDAVLEAASPGS